MGKKKTQKKSRTIPTTKKVKLSKKATYKLFTYGTLQIKDVQKWLWGEEKEGTPARLEGFKTITNGQIPFMFPTNDKSDVIDGQVYEINYDQIINTNHYEGPAYRLVGNIKTADGNTVWAYLLARKA